MPEYVRVHVCTHTCPHTCRSPTFPTITFYLMVILLHAWGCTHVQTCVGVHVMQCVCAMCLCVQRPEVGTLVFLDHFPPYALIQISRLNPKLANRLAWLASLLLSFPVSHSHALALQDSCPTHLGVTWVLGISTGSLYSQSSVLGPKLPCLVQN